MGNHNLYPTIYCNSYRNGLSLSFYFEKVYFFFTGYGVCVCVKMGVGEGAGDWGGERMKIY